MNPYGSKHPPSVTNQRNDSSLSEVVFIIYYARFDLRILICSQLHLITCIHADTDIVDWRESWSSSAKEAPCH